IVGDAVGRPHAQRSREGFAQRVLGARDVTRAGGEEGDEAAVAFARDAFGGAADIGLGCLAGITHFQLPLGTWTGRISMAPKREEGQRFAQATASSRSAASTKK